MGTSGGGRSVTLGGSNTGINTIAGTIRDNFGTGTGTGWRVGLTKQDAGTWVVAGANTYTAATNVNGGTLEIGSTGSTHASSAVTVSNADTKLVVNGTVNGVLTANVSTIIGGTGTVAGVAAISGTLSPGAGPGTLTFGNTLGLGATALALMEINGTAGAGVSGGHDFVNLTGIDAAGVLTYGGAMTLDLGATFGAGSYSWNLFDFASETGTFTTISLADQYSGSLLDEDLNGVWDLTSGDDIWTFTESSGVLALTTTAIPEPAAALLGGLGLLALLRRRRNSAGFRTTPSSATTPRRPSSRGVS